MKKIIKNILAAITLILVFAITSSAQISQINRKLVQCFILDGEDIVQIGNDCEFGSFECRPNPCTPGLG